MIVCCAKCETIVGSRPGEGETCLSPKGREIYCDKCRDKHSEFVYRSPAQIHAEYGVAIADFSYAGM